MSRTSFAARAWMTGSFLALAILASGCRQTAWSPDGRFLAVSHKGTVRVLDTDTHKWVTAAAGKEGERWAMSPAWSADSRKVALFLAHGLDKERASDLKLVIFDRTTSESKTLVEALPVPPQERDQIENGEIETRLRASWEAGGGRLAIQIPWAEGGRTGSAIWVVEPDGKLSRLTPQGMEQGMPSWRPGSSEIAVHQEEGAEPNLKRSTVLISPGAPPRVLTEHDPGWTPCWEPVWSTDGRRIGIIAGKEPEGDQPEAARAIILDARSGKELKRFEVPGPGWTVSLTPDLETVCFYELEKLPDGSDKGYVSLLRAPGAKPQRLADAEPMGQKGSAYAPMLSPNGKRIAVLFAPEEGRPMVRILSLDQPEMQVNLPD